MQNPDDIPLVQHQPISSTDDEARFNMYEPKLTITKEYYNFTNRDVYVMEPGFGKVVVDRYGKTRHTKRFGLYVRYVVSYHESTKLTTSDLNDHPFISYLSSYGKLTKKNRRYYITYVHFIPERELMDKGIVFDTTVNSYIGFTTEDWGKLEQTNHREDTRGVALGYGAEITVVDPDRESVYLVGFSKITRVRTTTPQRSGMESGVYVNRYSPEEGRYEIKKYTDVKSCRNDIDIPIFDRYNEAEEFALSRTTTTTKKTGSKQEKVLNRSTADRSASTATPLETSATGDRVLGIVESFFYAIASFFRWMGVMKDDPEPPLPKAKK